MTGGSSGAVAVFNTDKFNEPNGIAAQLNAQNVTICTRISDTEMQLLFTAMASTAYTAVNVDDDPGQRFNGEHFSYVIPPAAIVVTAGRKTTLRPLCIPHWGVIVEDFIND